MLNDQEEKLQSGMETADAEVPASFTSFDFSAMEMSDYDQTIKIFSEGDIINGKIVRVDKDEVLLDIGYKSEGVIPARELSIRYDLKPGDIVQVGDEIEALVLQKEDKDGRLILSKKRAQYERAWNKLETLKRDGEPVRGDVIEVVKGGLIVDIGLRGFLPASLVESHRVRELQNYVGQEIECKIIEMDKNRNNVVLSRRALLEATAVERRKSLLDRLEKGQVVTGSVSSIVSFGAFVNLGGIDGLIHISELSWCHVEKPGEVVVVGDEVTCEILDVDRERERVSLSLKACQTDPWEQLSTEVRVGDVIDGMVTKLVPFGAFVQVAPGIEGLIHISELSHRHVELPEEIVSVNEEIKVKVIDIDIDRRRISLSLKQLEDLRQETVYEEEDHPEGTEREEESAVAATEPERTELVEPVEATIEEASAEAEEVTEEPEQAPTPEKETVVTDGSLQSIIEDMKAGGAG